MSEADMIQRSDEWLQARVGSLGASALHEVVARTKTGYSASRANRLAALLVERLTGQPLETYQNAAMLHGIETEPEARAAYAFEADVDVTEIGLVRHPRIQGTHASPDGLVSSDGLLEIKCPQPPAHLALLLGEPIPDKYIVQMLWQMECADRSWCDFVSYNAAFPPHLRLLIKRVHRDDERIASLQKEVISFLSELEGAVQRLAPR